jgi:hypothetical protein
MKSKLKFIFVFLICLLLFNSCKNYGELIKNDALELYYTPTVTYEEAMKLEGFLVNLKFNEGNRKTIQVNRNDKIYELKLVIKKGMEQDEQTIYAMKYLSQSISESVFNNKEVDIHLCDERLNTLRVVISN